jgi:CIC family chloride channel protein
VDRVLSGDLVLRTVVLLAFLKGIATAVCYASGNAGGVFGPSMFIGAMMGAAVGAVAHTVLPASTAGPGAYALVGMGTAFAGIIRTPLTSVIMIFEVTRDYTIIVPLMISNMIAFYISQRLQPEPLYEALAKQDGLHLPTGEFRHHSRQHDVNSAIREAPEPLTPELTLEEAFARVGDSVLRSWPVADQDGMLGMVRVSDIERRVGEGAGAETLGALLSAPHNEATGAVRAHVPAPGEFVHVHGDQPLGQALSRMGETGHTVLPVVSRANARILLAIVTLDDVLRAYGVEHVDQIASDAAIRG